MKILVAGASGFIGSSLVPFLEANGHEVHRLVRGRPKANDKEIPWDPRHSQLDIQALEGFDAVVNLSGENIMGRWSDDKKRRILNSRVETTRLLCSAYPQLKNPPIVHINASAIGYYGDTGENWVDENSPVGAGFLAGVCRDWEAATEIATTINVRVVNLRFGLVLSEKGGALEKMSWPFSLGLGGTVGSGAQYWSWITLDDLQGAILHCIQHPEVRGAVNAVTPSPVTNTEFTKTLGTVLGRPTFLSIPGAMARFALGEMAEELLMASNRVEPKRLKETGFYFRYPELERALRFLLEK